MNDKQELMSMRESYGHMFIGNLALGNPTTRLYQFIIDKSTKNPVVITQLLFMNRLVLCVNLQSCIAYMFYGRNFHITLLYLLGLIKVKFSMCIL